MRIIVADVVILVVGLLLFASAGTALYVRGDLSTATTSPIGLYNVVVSESTKEIDTQSVSSMQSASPRFRVGDGNVTVVLVEVTCTDNQVGAASPFTYGVTVTGPQNLRGSSGPGRPCSGIQRIEVPVAAAPSTTSAQGGSPGEAEQSLMSSANRTRAQGDWTVTISGSRSNAGPLPVPAPQGSVTLSVTQWRAALTPVSR